MEVTMIGTGSAFSKEYGNTSALVTFDDGYNLLIDCGFTVPAALHQLGEKSPLMHIDGILITHIHADHVGGLEEVAFMNRYVYGGRKMDLFVPYTLEYDLWNHSLRGGLQYTEEAGECSLEDYFNVHELYPFGENNLGIYIYPTDHVTGKESYAVGIERMFFSGDTKFDTNLIKTAVDNYDIIFHDCQLFDQVGGVHASLNQLLTLPKEIQERIYLMHYGDNMEEFLGKSGRMVFSIAGATYPV